MFSVYLTCGYRTERYIVDKKENSNNEQTIYMDNGHRTTFMCSPFYETNLRNQDEFLWIPAKPSSLTCGLITVEATPGKKSGKENVDLT